MLAVLVTAVHPNGTAPQEWNDLPKGKLLNQAGRTKCSGLPCIGVRVFKDSADSLWLVSAVGIWSAGLPPEVGVAMVSLDPNAAKWNTNLWITFIGY